MHLQPGTDRCVFLDAARTIYLPVAHGEGKVCFANDDLLEKAKAAGQVALFRLSVLGTLATPQPSRGEHGREPAPLSGMLVRPPASTGTISWVSASCGRFDFSKASKEKRGFVPKGK